MKRLLLILLIILISGCTAECKNSSDCTATNNCFQARCVDKLCKQDKIPACCGNKDPEPIENGKQGNKCTCPEDYGPCTGDVPDTTYLSMSCENNECVSNIKPNMQKEQIISEQLSTDIGTIKVDSTFPIPFNIKKDLFTADISIPFINENIQDIIIKRIQLIGETSFFADKAISRSLWNTETVISENLILSSKLAALEQTISDLKLVIAYEYRTPFGKQTGSADLPLNIQFIYVKPEARSQCPEECTDNDPNTLCCDDQNTATEDSCSSATNYFCSHKPIANMCGNFLCETAEDKCSCPDDCGPCEGDIGQYLQYTCAPSCKVILKQSTVLDKKTDFEERDLTGFQMNFKYNYDTPFSLKNSDFTIDLELTGFSDVVRETTITAVRLFEGSFLLGEMIIPTKFAQVGSKQSVSIPINEFADYESKKTITAKVWYEYEETFISGTETIITPISSSFEKDLGVWTFLKNE